MEIQIKEDKRPLSREKKKNPITICWKSTIKKNILNKIQQEKSDSSHIRGL